MTPPSDGRHRDASAYLAAHEFPPGLVEAILRTKTAFAHRYWVVDNSGSMALLDGKRVEDERPRGGKPRMVSCSRYEEVREIVHFHAHLAALLGCPTTFAFLNHPHKDHSGAQDFAVASKADLPALLDAAAAHPYDGDPICARVRSVAEAIGAREAELRASGQRVAVVIVTDGLPSDGNLAKELEHFGKLPATVVVRLCCDDRAVVRFWNHLDHTLETVHLNVLDDLHAEAHEVAEHNPFITYGAPLHRLREWGVHEKVVDVIDERPLAADEICTLCSVLFGQAAAKGLPAANVSADAFVDAVVALQRASPAPHDMLHAGTRAWIDGESLRKYLHGRYTLGEDGKLRDADAKACVVQ
ncbi:hypothetical protein KFE25_013185 [Diacronema lutheri]|uniref:VWFA domain-containing protein n=1 Tax=Diacronema lutheri TaxID=2081491 RepID=A0A8J6C8D0_DIALT|nr:hypothetical protein KFE25_013185 [Diacronema lutheri]